MEERKYYKRAIDKQLSLYLRFPNRTDVINVLGSMFLNIENLSTAKDLFYRSLGQNKNDYFAMANLGYVLYFEANNILSMDQNHHLGVGKFWKTVQTSSKKLFNPDQKIF